MNPLSRNAKKLEYAFHTDPEIAPYWSCAFKWPIIISRLKIYNRDNPLFINHIHEIIILVKELNGRSQVVFSQKNPSFSGRSANRPLHVKVDNVYCIGITIKVINRIAAPLHLQEIKIFRKLPTINLKSLGRVSTRSYTCSLSRSGFGDKLLDLATGSYVLEALGFRFAGLDPRSLQKACRITTSSDSPIDIYRRLGFLELAAEDKYIENPYVIKLGDQVNELTFDALIQYVANDVSEHACSYNYTSIQLSVSPLLCERLLRQDSSKPFASCLHSEAMDAVKRTINTRLHETYSGTLNIVIHLRLGDVANLQIDDDTWMIPFECAWARKLKFLTDRQRKEHERYDRLPIVAEILNILSASSKRSSMTITLVSDGTLGTQNFVINTLRPLVDSPTQNVLDKALLSIRSIDEELNNMRQFADQSLVGESSEMFCQAARAILNADVIISTNGHYCYQLSLLSAKSPLMAMAYMARTQRDPVKHTLYWSRNDKYDVGYIVNAIESIA